MRNVEYGKFLQTPSHLEKGVRQSPFQKDSYAKRMWGDGYS